MDIFTAQYEGGKIAVDTVFIGGGTPSMLKADDVNALMDALHHFFSIKDGAEITIEVNPESVSFNFLKVARKVGINRLSIGVQSLDDNMLRKIGRLHNAENALLAYKNAREAGFENISVDLIHGLPGQSMEMAMYDLVSVIEWGIDHLSSYCLKVESGTPFESMLKRGQITLPDDDLLGDMYEKVCTCLEDHKFIQYEISNFALSNRECMHNMTYWKNNEYLGLGAAAWSYIDLIRGSNSHDVQQYIYDIHNGMRMQGERNINNTIDDIIETVIMNLRLLRTGIDENEFFIRYGFRLEDVLAKPLRKNLDNGLLIYENKSWKLSKRGAMLSNQVMTDMLDLDPGFMMFSQQIK